MDYPIFAILWVIATLLIVLVGRKSIFKIFGMPPSKSVSAIWRMYLFCCMIIGAAISIGITFIIKATF